jgi:hypothetical protein
VSAVLAIVEEAVQQDPDERVEMAVSHVLAEYPFARGAVERAARGAPQRQQERAWLAALVDEAAQLTADVEVFPRVRDAQLPVRYEELCREIAECVSLQESRQYESQAAALAAAARRMADERLLDFAVRTQVRATRRCGELLLEIAGAQGARTDLEPNQGARTRLQSATGAGMSRHQMVQAIRLARLPIAEFDAAVEASSPATVTELAARGRQPRPPTAHEVAWKTSELLREIAVIADTNEAVRAALATAGITSRMLRAHVQALQLGGPAP